MRCEMGLQAAAVRYASVSCCIGAVQRTDGHGRQGASGIPTAAGAVCGPQQEQYIDRPAWCMAADLGLQNACSGS